MKIYHNDKIPLNLPPDSKAKTQPTTEKEFGAILKETVENKNTAELTPMPTTFINPLSGVQSIPSSPPGQQVVIDGIEDMIDLLDRYREKLADPRISLKKIDPIIKEMTREMENLAPVLESLSEGEELNNILNQTLVTTSLELNKFYRGDYISG